MPVVGINKQVALAKERLDTPTQRTDMTCVHKLYVRYPKNSYPLIGSTWPCRVMHNSRMQTLWGRTASMYHSGTGPCRHSHSSPGPDICK